MPIPSTLDRPTIAIDSSLSVSRANCSGGLTKRERRATRYRRKSFLRDSAESVVFHFPFGRSHVWCALNVSRKKKHFLLWGSVDFRTQIFLKIWLLRVSGIFALSEIGDFVVKTVSRRVIEPQLWNSWKDRLQFSNGKKVPRAVCRLPGPGSRNAPDKMTQIFISESRFLKIERTENGKLH